MPDFDFTYQTKLNKIRGLEAGEKKFDAPVFQHNLEGDMI